MRKTLIAGTIAVSALIGSTLGVNPAGSTPTAPKAPAPSKVYVVHGLKLDSAGTKVDVFAGAEGDPVADAGQLLNDFTYKSTAGPLSLAPASYTIYVASPAAGNDGKLAADEVLFSKTLAVPSGQNLSAVASLDAGGNPTINVFANNLSKVPAGGGRISIRHAAAAPEVKVDLGYLPYSRQFSFFTNRYGPVANGQQGDVTTAAGKYDIVVRLASNLARVSAVPRFPVAPGKLTAVYVVGTPGSTLGYVVQTITL